MTTTFDDFDDDITGRIDHADEFDEEYWRSLLTIEHTFGDDFIYPAVQQQEEEQ